MRTNSCRDGKWARSRILISPVRHQSTLCPIMVPMETQFTTHERHILASDRALIEAAELVCRRVPLRGATPLQSAAPSCRPQDQGASPLQEWPTHLRVAVSMALTQACDDTRLAKNRISAHRANDLHRFLSRRGIIPSAPCEANFGEQVSEDSEYLMDRLLANLVTKVCALEYKQVKRYIFTMPLNVFV